MWSSYYYSILHGEMRFEALARSQLMRGFRTEISSWIKGPGSFLCIKTACIGRESGVCWVNNREAWTFSTPDLWRTYQLIMQSGHCLRLITYLPSTLIDPDRKRAVYKVLLALHTSKSLLGRQGVVIIYLAFGLSSVSSPSQMSFKHW